MRIQELFERDIHRSINGVVKADQLDESSVWQELDEFVVTRELTRHFSDLIETLLATVRSEAGSEDRNGVWVSGFFGSGKSHFIKVLSYLLDNDEHCHQGDCKKAIEFFSRKFDDAMLYGDLKEAVSAGIETILFNVDSKAEHHDGRDALLQVFVKVLNEKLGYSSDHPHIADMERHLDERGLLESFQDLFEKECGSSWLDERDAWEFHRDEMIVALKQVLEQSEESVARLVDGSEEHFSLSVEKFAKWVAHYLNKQGPSARLMFLVDEVGQFIGNDTHLMLNLQTITEQLGVVCKGRAWVVVTSQEDLDAVLGDLTTARQQDYSKIQGRFQTRLSLSSANVDEVIKRRLLQKGASAHAPLVQAYEGKHDILRNQLSFMKAGMTFKHYENADDFAACYPFAAYQFKLAQKVFESIRKAGATGLHLSQGERSILDAFQGAAKRVSANSIGSLVPFYEFYPAVEGFLDTAVRRTIEQAAENHSLEPFDVTLLKVLFLIRYIDELPGSVDNLVTLCVDEIDSDKLALRHQIEASLRRLEAETLIARNGDLYFFLTNEERDVSREIKSVSIASGADERELGKLLFEDLLGDTRKHTYGLTGRDFAFTRICDGHPVGNRIEGSLEVMFVSPIGDEYAMYDDTRCLFESGSGGGRVLIRLPDNSALGRDLRAYLQTEEYVKTKNTGSLPETTKRILRERSEDNRGRRLRIVETLKDMLLDANYFASGERLEIAATKPAEALGEALEYLIRNAFPKMAFIEHLHPDPKPEIQRILRANDVEQVALALEGQEANPQALADLREYIRLSAMQNKQLVLSEVIHGRYGGQPYGWPELELVLLIARLAVLKEVNLVLNGAPLALDQAYDHLVSSQKQRRVVISRRESAAGDLIKKAQTLGKKLFAAQGPGTEEELFTWAKQNLTAWHQDLSSFRTLAETGKYPGLGDIQTVEGGLRKFLEESDSLTFLKRFVENEADLLDHMDDVHQLQDFYTNQKRAWERLQSAVEEFEQNRMQLKADESARSALQNLQDIKNLERPYARLSQVEGLIEAVRIVNEALIAKARSQATQEIQGRLQNVSQALDQVSAESTLRTNASGELEGLSANVSRLSSIAHINQARDAADGAFDRALEKIEQAQQVVTGPGEGGAALPPAALKKRKVITPRELCNGEFLETPADIEDFLKRLRKKLEEAMAAEERVQIK